MFYQALSVPQVYVRLTQAAARLKPQALTHSKPSPAHAWSQGKGLCLDPRLIIGAHIYSNKLLALVRLLSVGGNTYIYYMPYMMFCLCDIGDRMKLGMKPNSSPIILTVRSVFIDTSHSNGYTDMLSCIVVVVSSYSSYDSGNFGY